MNESLVTIVFILCIAYHSSQSETIKKLESDYQICLEQGLGVIK